MSEIYCRRRTARSSQQSLDPRCDPEWWRVEGLWFETFVEENSVRWSEWKRDRESNRTTEDWSERDSAYRDSDVHFRSQVATAYDDMVTLREALKPKESDGLSLAPLLANIVFREGPPSDQATFKNDMIAQYDSLGPGGSLWCPVLRRYGFNRTAHHIFPGVLEDAMVDRIFGQGAREGPFSPSNGLFLDSQIQGAVDNHQLVIIPASGVGDDANGRRHIIRVIDKDILRQTHDVLGVSYAQLDGRDLVFRTPFRPRKCYLYFHFIISLLAMKIRLGNSDVAVEELSQAWKIWTIPGAYILEDVLVALAKEIGHYPESLLEHAIPAVENWPGETDWIVLKLKMDILEECILCAYIVDENGNN
ncbi:MAG: hypothetical protein M1839_002243 [Geoglossum umbratile]|nr:MAG: hypothetical protein M1839_002243 [Geoglossum umbratile]